MRVNIHQKSFKLPSKVCDHLCCHQTMFEECVCTFYVCRNMTALCGTHKDEYVQQTQHMNS